MQENRDSWGVLAHVDAPTVFKWLQAQSLLEKLVLKGSTHQQEFIRYLRNEPTVIEIAATLRSTSYLCHSSAMFVHALLDQQPSVLYVNYEQSAKPRPPGGLTQASVDRAFRGKQRESTFAFECGESQIILLSGKHTNNLEVQNSPLPSGATVRVTSIERTLIDISVRPSYAGGVEAVLEAYPRAKGRIAIPKLPLNSEEARLRLPFSSNDRFLSKSRWLPEKVLDAAEEAWPQLGLLSGV